MKTRNHHAGRSEHGSSQALRHALLLSTALGLFALPVTPAKAELCSWDGTSGNGDWFDDGNWDDFSIDCPGVPTAGDGVSTNISTTDVTIDAGAAASSNLHLNAGRLTIANGGTLSSSGSYHNIGWASTPAWMTVTGAGSAWNAEVTNASSGIRIGRNFEGTLTLSEGGALNVSGAGNRVILGEYDSTFSLGTLNIGAAAGEAAVAPGVINTAVIEMGRGDDGSGELASGLIVFNHTDTSGAYTFAPTITGTGRMEHLGGTTVLTGTNTYDGGTVISGGKLVLGHMSSLDYDSVGSGEITLDGGTLDLSNLGVSLQNNIVVGASGGTITHSGGVPYVLGDISGSGALTFSGSGEIDLWGDNSSFSGTTTLSSGAILQGVNPTSFSPNSAYTVQSGGTLQLYVDNESIGSLAGTGDVNIGVSAGRSLILTVGADGKSTEFTGMISDGTGTLGLTKIGAGTFTLNGVNTYTGATTVSQGTLIVGDGSHPDARIASAVTVENGATLGGAGTVRNTTIADGGILAPGSSIGTLTVDGNLTLSSGSILDYELGSPGTSSNPASGTSDRIDVAGDLALNGTLDLSQGDDVTDGTADVGYYRLMTYGGTLTGDGLTIGDTPALADPAVYEIQTGSGNVDLFVAAAGDETLQHWQGGDGTWNANNQKWLNQGSTVPVAWAGNHAVFKNQPGSFDGGTIAVDGTHGFAGLQFVDGGYRLEGNGRLQTLAAGSEIRVLADSAEIASEIAGTGGFTKTQDGRLVLSGANTYSGGTTIAAGVVEVSEDDNLGSTSGGLTFAGGTLATTADMASARTINLEATGRFAVADGTALDLSGTVSGSGDLIKDGAGTLVLSGDNGYGNTLVEAGTLVGDAASISGDLANAGTAVFDQAADASFAGDITGLGGTDGMMIKEGIGTLTLEGASRLDWTVDEGGLAADAARFAGDVELAGTTTALTFTGDGNATYAGAISGNGRFALDGEGTVLLSGDSSGFAGTTALNAGTLLIGDTDGALGGSLDVLGSATLGGSGTIGSGAGSLITIASGGTIAPGNSTGTLTIDGDLVFAAGSRFAVEVNPQGTDSDLVSVTGDARLEGGAVAHIGATGEYDLRSTYTILSADGTLTGAFEDVTSDFAFLIPDLIYDYGAGTVDLELARNDTGFASMALTRNQTATAEGIESIGLAAGHAVYDTIAQSADDDDLIRASFDALSGEIHASAQTALIADSRFVRNAANDRIRAAFGSTGASVAPVLAYGPGEAPMAVAADHGGPVFWSHGLGSWGSTDGDGNGASLDRSAGGLLIGADTLVGDWRLGMLGGYSQSSFDAEDRASSGSSSSYHLGLYGGTQWGDIALRTGAAYTWHDIETNRTLAIPGLADTLSGDYGAGTFQAFGELAYGVELDAGTRLEPFANLAHVSLHTDSFAEQGGAAALRGEDGSTDVTFTTLGLRGEHHLTLGTMDATLKGTLGWRHAFGDVTPKSSHAFSAGNAFTIAGAPIARNSAIIEAGLDLNLSPQIAFGLSYQSQIASDASDHGFKANLSVRF